MLRAREAGMCSRLAAKGGCGTRVRPPPQRKWEGYDDSFGRSLNMGISVGDQIPDSRRRRGGAWHQRRSMGAVRRSGNQPDANLANSAVNLCNCN